MTTIYTPDQRDVTLAAALRQLVSVRAYKHRAEPDEPMFTFPDVVEMIDEAMAKLAPNCTLTGPDAEDVIRAAQAAGEVLTVQLWLSCSQCGKKTSEEVTASGPLLAKGRQFCPDCWTEHRRLMHAAEDSLTRLQIALAQRDAANECCRRLDATGLTPGRSESGGKERA